MKIVALQTYPIKGFSPMDLNEARVEKHGTMPLDRAYAIENGRSGFDPADPRHLPKVNFLCLMRNERMAEFETIVDADSGNLTVKRKGSVLLQESLTDDAGRKRIEDWISIVFAEELRGKPTIHYAQGHSFSDWKGRVLHLINLASLRELESKISMDLHPTRFRANILIDGAPPFSELEWIGKSITAPSMTFTAVERTKRCAATNVDPLTGVRDGTIPAVLQSHYGHSDFGIYIRADSAGNIAVGEPLSLT